MSQREYDTVIRRAVTKSCADAVVLKEGFDIFFLA